MLLTRGPKFFPNVFPPQRKPCVCVAQLLPLQRVHATDEDPMRSKQLEKLWGLMDRHLPSGA